MRWLAYPEYRESGVEWLGGVPKHWRVNRLKWSTDSCVNGSWGDEPNGVTDVVCVRVADFDRDHLCIRSNPPTLRSIGPAERIRLSLRCGDLLLEKSGGGDSQPVGYVVQFQHAFDAVCSNFIARLRIRTGLHARYWLYVHAALYAAGLNSRAIKQTTGIQNLDWSAYFDECVPFPPIEEQRAIADLLDAELLRMDMLIEKKRTLIEKLREKRLALISRTVAQGLPPAADLAHMGDSQTALRPSGIEWLDEVPWHWEVRPIKAVAVVGNGSTPNREDSRYWKGSYPWLNSSVVNEHAVSKPSDFVTEAALRECHLPKVVPPAVLVGITGEGRTRGLASVLIFEATVNQHLAFIKPMPQRCDARFLRLVLTCAYSYMRDESDGSGSTKGAITCEQLANMRVPLPPLSEQRAIADFLERETKQIDSLIEIIEQAIETLREYRAALITAAVTGKIDVRGSTPRAEAV